MGDCSFSGAAATACADLGLRGTIYLEVFGDGADVVAERFEPMRERIAGALSDGTVRLGISPHAPYTCSLELYRACDELDLPVATHLAESEDENEFLRTGGGEWEAFADMLVAPLGTTGIRALAGAGLLGDRVLAAHCVRADEEEIALLAEHDVAVAHCPARTRCSAAASHLSPTCSPPASGSASAPTAPRPRPRSTCSRSEDGRRACEAREQRLEAMSPARVLELATLGSAAALGLDDEIGSLEPGKQADLAVVSLDGSPYVPWEDPAGAVVMGGSASRVLLTLVGGEVRYEAETFPWHELRQRGIEARAKLLGR